MAPVLTESALRHGIEVLRPAGADSISLLRLLDVAMKGAAAVWWQFSAAEHQERRSTGILCQALVRTACRYGDAVRGPRGTGPQPGRLGAAMI
ncbi:hypothetical protein [Micromonospora echinofusca]|uniref:TetR family transcriptional regulator n=1 Tax=Micromonospora echinofusca TaxID=47858 RepID=A0ABS3VKQ0_MICEH|nr:hypothetical protein [Micromonospora echinofusca]MBO4205095.1 hypothetical protein [Micromonospora echinofusca]